MARGIPSKWIEVKVHEPFFVGKRGIFYVTVGGLWWREHEKKNWKKISWDKLVELFENK